MPMTPPTQNVESESSLCPWERALVFLALAAFCIFGLFDHSLWSANDSREGAMMMEMLRDGRWLTPVFNGELYLEKPPMLHWTAMVFSRVFGGMSEGVARLPAAVYGFCALLIVWQWAREMGRERAGVAGVFMCASSALYAEYSRIVLTDAALAFMVLLSLRLFWTAYNAADRGMLRMLEFIVVSALSFYAKGLIGPGLVWTSVCGLLAWRRDWKRLVLLPCAFLPVFILTLAPWAWALWKEGGADTLKTVFWANQFGRFLVFSDASLPADPYFVHKEPVYFYLLTIPARLAPWTLIAAAALFDWFRRQSPFQGGAEQFLKISLAAMALVLHVSSAKAECYALPLFPVIFLMAGVWLERLAAEWRPCVRAAAAGVTLWTLAAAFAIAPLLFMIAAAVPRGAWMAAAGAFSEPAARAVGIGLDFLSAPGKTALAACFLLAAAAFAAAVFFILKLRARWRAGERSRVLLSAPVLMSALAALNSSVFICLYDHHRSYVPFAELVRREVPAHAGLGVFGGMEKEAGAFMFYLDRRLDVIPPGGGLRAYLEDNDGAGIVVPLRHAGKAEAELDGVEYRVVKSAHPGYKSAGFLLFLNTK